LKQIRTDFQDREAGFRESAVDRVLPGCEGELIAGWNAEHSVSRRLEDELLRHGVAALGDLAAVG